MKFLVIVNKLFLFFLQLSILFSSFDKSCIQNLFSFNKHILNHNYIVIKSFENNIKSDSLIIFIEKDIRCRIQYNNKIIIADHTKTINFNSRTNQLYIDKSDPFMMKWINIKK